MIIPKYYSLRCVFDIMWKEILFEPYLWKLLTLINVSQSDTPTTYIFCPNICC